MKGNNYTSLVIGDVGSGKTYVAILSGLIYLKNSVNAKASLVAPTEVLAYQHYKSLLKIAESCGINDITIVFLSSKLKYVNDKKVTKLNYEELSEQKIFVVGTHSVFNSSQLKFDLVLIDEQHRFGVDQRGIFANHPHHFVSFTATPIPRTLALSLFNKLDTLFIEKLVGRAKIDTNLMKFDTFFSNHSINEITKEYFAKNEKIYIVCPKIDIKESEDKIWSVTEIFEHFNNIFPGKVLSMTGKDKNKRDILRQFKEDDNILILISTTVIEVGVDVGNAKCIFIINAERFGLAALHQLRGRVGRNNDTNNRCYLVVNENFYHSKRLKILTETEDGFLIAESDMKNRGYGDIAGTMQSGFSDEIEMLTKPAPQDLEYLTTLTQNLDINTLPRLKNYINNKLENYHGE